MVFFPPFANPTQSERLSRAQHKRRIACLLVGSIPGNARRCLRFQPRAPRPGGLGNEVIAASSLAAAAPSARPARAALHQPGCPALRPQFPSGSTGPRRTLQAPPGVSCGPGARPRLCPRWPGPAHPSPAPAGPRVFRLCSLHPLPRGPVKTPGPGRAGSAMESLLCAHPPRPSPPRGGRHKRPGHVSRGRGTSQWPTFSVHTPQSRIFSRAAASSKCCSLSLHPLLSELLHTRQSPTPVHSLLECLSACPVTYITCFPRVLWEGICPPHDLELLGLCPWHTGAPDKNWFTLPRPSLMRCLSPPCLSTLLQPAGVSSTSTACQHLCANRGEHAGAGHSFMSVPLGPSLQGPV